MPVSPEIEELQRITELVERDMDELIGDPQ
jgi:hypothetical protein